MFVAKLIDALQMLPPWTEAAPITVVIGNTVYRITAETQASEPETDLATAGLIRIGPNRYRAPDDHPGEFVGELMGVRFVAAPGSEITVRLPDPGERPNVWITQPR